MPRGEQEDRIHAHEPPENDHSNLGRAVRVTRALADDFKTINGKEYKDATVTSVEPDGILVKTKSGISKIYFVELPKNVQQRFNYEPQSPPLKLQIMQQLKINSTSKWTKRNANKPPQPRTSLKLPK